MSQEQALARGVAQLGIEVAPEVQKKMLDFLALLQKWNKVYSLTAIRQPEQLVSHPLLDRKPVQLV